MKPDIIQQCDQLPPILVRFLARKNYRLLPLRTIARESGLSVYAVECISRLTSWRALSLENGLAFSKACGHDLLRPRRNLQYVAHFLKTGRGFSHLNKSQLKQFAKALDVLNGHQGP